MNKKTFILVLLALFGTISFAQYGFRPIPVLLDDTQDYNLSDLPSGKSSESYRYPFINRPVTNVVEDEDNGFDLPSGKSSKSYRYPFVNRFDDVQDSTLYDLPSGYLPKPYGYPFVNRPESPNNNVEDEDEGYDLPSGYSAKAYRNRNWAADHCK